MGKIPAELYIQNLRGGLNDFDNPNALGEDQCTVVENIDFTRSTLGGRRLGTDVIDMTSSTLSGAIVFLFRHHLVPNPGTNPAGDAELWAVSTTNFTTFVINRKTFAGGWQAVTPTDNITVWNTIRGLTFHGKLFLAYASATDRLHVWDGTSLRRTGLLIAGAPTVANTGAGSYPAVLRFYRVRFTRQVSGVTVSRGEPGASASFTPSGTGTAARVTKPASISEGETHWELEASTDDVLFYRIATTVVGTTTFDDTNLVATYPNFPLSEDVGDYTNIPAGKYLAADEDRLIIAGSWQFPALQARVTWTPVFGDPGSANDERIPIDTNNYLDLDAQEGGEISDMTSSPLNGYLYVFKRKAIYKLIRTGSRIQAYDAINVTKSLGALGGSVIEGQDEYGSPCVYFIDPERGPHRIGSRGIEACGYDIQGSVKLFSSNTLEAYRIIGLWNPNTRQAMWWVALEPATETSHVLVATTREFQMTQQGARRGWAHYTSDYASNTLSACLFTEDIDAGIGYGLKVVPFIGKGAGAAIHRTGTTNQDNGVNFKARLITKPFTLGGLLTKFGVMAANLMAKAQAGVTVFVKMTRNYGEETKSFSTLLTAVGSETRVIRPLSEVNIANTSTLQVEIGDDVAANVDWELDAIALKLRSEESQ